MMTPDRPPHHDLVDELLDDALIRLEMVAGIAARRLMAGVDEDATRTALETIVSAVERAIVEVRQAYGRAAA